MTKNILTTVLCSLFVLAAAVAGPAQDLDFSTLFTFEPARITSPPQVGDINITFPEEARKNGVEGTAKVRLKLGADGQVHEAAIIQDLPYGVGDAVKRAAEKLKFTPAAYNGKPADLFMTITYEVAATYSEYDKNVSKVQLTQKPFAEYPSNRRSDGIKGSVKVGALFYVDGKVKVLEIQSTMPEEFDEAARKAAANLKFQPALHKKSKKMVNQTMWVTFDFKP